LTTSAGSWESVGLDSLKINCIYPAYNSIIVGTEKGLYFLDGENWIQYGGVPDLPIHDIIAYGKTDMIGGQVGSIMVSAGNGSNSDGI